MGRAPDDAAGADHGAGRGDVAVVLADVDAVGPRGDGEVGPVVDDEQRAGGGAQLAGRLRGGEELGVGRVLVAQLEDVDPAAQCRTQHVGQRPAAGAAVADEVQAGGVEPLVQCAHAH